VCVCVCARARVCVCVCMCVRVCARVKIDGWIKFEAPWYIAADIVMSRLASVLVRRHS